MSSTTLLATVAAHQPGRNAAQLGVTLGHSSKQSNVCNDIKSVVAAAIPAEQERLRNIKRAHGTRSLGEVTVDQALGGMRAIPGMLWEVSLLDAEEGIRLRGYTIAELQRLLPTVNEGGEPMPEGLLWLLLTGQIPTKAQAEAVSEELRRRAALPDYVKRVLEALPADAHPMTQFAAGILALQPESQFAKAYEAGLPKSRYWDPVLEDSLNLIAKLPAIAATIYRKAFHGGDYIEPDASLDWAANLAHMMGFDDEGCREMMRMYLTIHADHEGGNVSAHATHLVGSALSDPYLCLAAGVAGLAGPLHGLANQEVLRWMFDVQRTLGAQPTKEQLTQFVWDTLNAGKVVPGYGHAVLRTTDPRYTCQREFALKHMADYPLFKLCSDLYEVVPAVLLKTGKVKNPWPNVDSHSGVLLQFYGIKEESFYTVLFGVSRALGVLAQGVWSRALGFPLERPKSLTMELIEKKFAHTHD
ncbi:citrate synthase [Monoraphidium neglectum]|uniref:Citrate synthase n=1 Tax=Monoraphidium neglectum TaxID=145388 RepID=A0A0D2L836_9CHLO|nr:citrate synthase [Monoraphidium neglectum]KIZ03019.1 citrate synthase [Monoraphidium neglectum]|eukprot:XP_013902038.1 citrate synthase [Monoraphidium neglectum]